MAKAKGKDTKPAAPAPDPAEPEKKAPVEESGVSKALVATACKDLEIDPETVESAEADGKAVVLTLKASAGGTKARYEPK